MATTTARQSDLRKKLAQRDEAIRKKIETELSKKRIVTPQGIVRKGNAAAVKGTLAALKPAPILTVPENASVADACQLCATRKTDCALILDEDRLIGIITSQDLTYRVVAEGLDPRTTLVRHVMTLDPVASSESLTAAHGLELMITKKINHLPVMNEDGKVVGVLDFMKVFFEILSHAFRKASASDQLLNAMAGVQTELGNDGSNSELLSWAKSLSQKTALPDLSSIISTRTQPIIVGPKVSVREVAQLMKDKYSTAVCIMEDAGPAPGPSRQASRLSGIFTTKDIVLRVIAAGQDAARCSVVRVMTPQPDKVQLSTDIYDAVKMMHGGSYFHLPVVEENDRLVAVFDVQVLAEATQEQVKGANQDIPMPDAANGPMWGRFFDSIGNKTQLSALPGSALLFGSPGDGNDQMLARELEVEQQSPESDLRPLDSISVSESASVSPENSMRLTPSKNAGSNVEATAPSAEPSTVVEPVNYVFKFRTPAGMNYRLFTPQDDYNALKALVGEKLAKEPVFEDDHHDTSGPVPDPHDFRISYTDEDDDAVFIDSDRDVLDAVNVARKASSDRVMLTVHPGRSWTGSTGGKEKEKSVPIPEPPPVTEIKPDTPAPPPPPPEPRKIDVEPVQEAPPRYTPTYEHQTAPLDLPQAYTAQGSPGISPNAASKLKEAIRHLPERDDPVPVLNGLKDTNQPSSSTQRSAQPLSGLSLSQSGEGSKTVVPTFDDKKRPLVEEKAAFDNSKSLILHFASVLADTHRYKRLLKCRGDDAQKLLDTFQTLLDIPVASPVFRRNLIVATQRLSRSSELYPTCYTLRDIEVIDQNPVNAGGFADIHKGRFFGQVVCLKFIRVYQNSGVQSFLKRFASEAILWGQLSHTNLLPIYGLYQYENRLCLVSPWMNNGNVSEYLHEHPDANRISLVSDIASGIAYLHEHDIVHGDLKGANILVDGSGRACLADFGLSAVSDPEILHWSSHSLVGSKGGSIRWQAPELFEAEGEDDIQNTKSSDVYSYGCVVYEVFSGNVPFAEIPRDAAVITKVRSGGHPTRPHPLSPAWRSWGLTEAIWSLMEACWISTPEKRPTIRNIISDYQFESLRDERPWNDDILSPANFRDSVGARASLPSITDVEAILDSVDLETETPLVSPPLAAPVVVAFN